MKTKVITVSMLAMSLCIASCGSDDDDPLTNNNGTDRDRTPAWVEKVDLGLPSKVLWANCNIGATSPGKFGDYFAWGETVGYTGGKTTFTWETYKYGTSAASITKYYKDDKKNRLELSDDAAHVNWGGDWRMPTAKEFKELLNTQYTTTIWTDYNGVRGRLITSKTNGNSIFLPAPGFYYGSSLEAAGSQGYYWTSDLDPSYDDLALRAFLDKKEIYQGNNTRRYVGQSVRAVCTGK